MKNWTKVGLSILGALVGIGATWFGINQYQKKHGIIEPNSPEDATGTRLGWKPPEEEQLAEQESPEEDEEESEPAPVVHNVSTVRAPHYIDDSEYMSDDEYTKNPLTYYKENQILADAESEIIDNPELYIGEDNLGSFKYRMDGEVVYIRNEKLHSDFEIGIDDGAFPVID